MLVNTNSNTFDTCGIQVYFHAKWIEIMQWRKMYKLQTQRYLWIDFWDVDLWNFMGLIYFSDVTNWPNEPINMSCIISVWILIVNTLLGFRLYWDLSLHPCEMKTYYVTKFPNNLFSNFKAIQTYIRQEKADSIKTHCMT